MKALVTERVGRDLLLAPTLLAYEVANICWKKIHRHPEQRAALIAAHARLGHLGCGRW